MKTDLEVEVEVDLRQLGKVLIFRDRQTNKQNLPIIYRYHHVWCEPHFSHDRLFIKFDSTMFDDPLLLIEIDQYFGK